VVLVPGFKADRTSMVPYAQFLHAAGFNVLLYDSRGTGASGGTFSLGVREVDDVRGAASYLSKRPDMRNHRIGLLGVSLGAGVVIAAAARLRAVSAVVADSAYVDQRAVVDRLDTLRLGRLALPLAPLAPWVVDRVLGVPLTSFSPIRAVRTIAPRGLLLIHSRHDANPTTPLSGALALHRAAGPSSLLWIAPRGGHAGALAAQPAEYQRRVVAFFRRYLGRSR
jgi:dipeptidyl aminopeptidase/acylaminoacyl peptidase